MVAEPHTIPISRPLTRIPLREDPIPSLLVLCAHLVLQRRLPISSEPCLQLACRQEVLDHILLRSVYQSEETLLVLVHRFLRVISYQNLRYPKNSKPSSRSVICFMWSRSSFWPGGVYGTARKEHTREVPDLGVPVVRGRRKAVKEENCRLISTLRLGKRMHHLGILRSSWCMTQGEDEGAAGAMEGIQEKRDM
ncbi:hypothetical protein K469DRAFT_696231 [Zopfia rhizophila CBS 207.26]|uniref:Uncharacterized protein n=1 Tax=Zopfia rhizophila CBS 207.26 TaxID=1314779 RepID=A0A6A6DHF4_9PEZI|nr:hypothetical protein K469DRAFT_696231 [Zopfia rhizophila CBS 207.26]